MPELCPIIYMKLYDRLELCMEFDEYVYEQGSIEITHPVVL